MKKHNICAPVWRHFESFKLNQERPRKVVNNAVREADVLKQRSLRRKISANISCIKAITMTSGISESMSCTMVNGVQRCERSRNDNGNIAAGSATAFSGPGGGSTYQGAGTGNTYDGNYDVQESRSGDWPGPSPNSGSFSSSSSSDNSGFSFYPPGWQGSSSYSSSSSGSGSGFGYGYSSGGGGGSSSSSYSGDNSGSFAGPGGFPGFGAFGGFPGFGAFGGFAGAGAFTPGFPGAVAFAPGFFGGGTGAFAAAGRRRR